VNDPEVSWLSYDFPWRQRFPEAELVAGFEGGAIYTAEAEGSHWVITDEGTFAGFLDHEDADLADTTIKLERYEDPNTHQARLHALAEQLAETKPGEVAHMEASDDSVTIDHAMEKLRNAARAHREAIEQLRKLGAIRSRSLVGDLGERLAADYYGVELEPASTPGFDLVTREADRRRVQVKTLRDTPSNHRGSSSPLSEPYDLMLAIRLDENYEPVHAIEVSREVLEEFFGKGRVSWTRRLEDDPRVRRITKEELLITGRSGT